MIDPARFEQLASALSAASERAQSARLECERVDAERLAAGVAAMEAYDALRKYCDACAGIKPPEYLRPSKAA